MKSHNHEEADTLIPLHVLLCLREGTYRRIHVWSPDTDVAILLLDLASNYYLGPTTELKLLSVNSQTGRSKVMDIVERAACIGKAKCRGLVGMHNFTGADWGGKFVGITKKTWAKAYFSLRDDDPVIRAFQLLGERELTSTTLVEDELPEDVQPLENFVCKVYCQGGPFSLPALRWHLFSNKCREGEMLPPTRGTLLPHILRANFISMRDKSYKVPHMDLPPLECNGWEMQGTQFMPVKSLCKAAPSCILELVKCGCQVKCGGNCSCFKNNLPCTPLCKCYRLGCSNITDYKVVNEDDLSSDD